MSIYADMASEFIGKKDKFKAYRKDATKPWKCLGILESALESSHGDDYDYERTVVYGQDLKKKKRTDRKTLITYQEDDYSWRTMKEVKIEDGDYLFLGMHWGNRKLSLFYEEKAVKIYKIRICPLSDTEANIELELVERWSSTDKELEVIERWSSADDETKFVEFFERLKPEFKKGVDKALEVKRRDRFWWYGKKYDIYDGL